MLPYNYRGISSPKLPRRYISCALKNDATKLLNLSWRIPNAVLAWFAFCARSQKASKRLAGRVVLATPTRKRPRARGRPKTRWHNYIFDPTWSRLGVEPADLSEVPENRKVFETS